MKEKYYELTAPQKSIWLTEQYYKNTNINNVCGTFYSDEILDFKILKKSLNTFLQTNDSFRIKLHFTEDKVVQYFSELKDIDFEIIDIKNKEEQSALEEKMASKVFRMFDSLLFEIVLFRYPDNHGGFVINSHHLISDSWTNGIVANDVALIYSKVKNNESYEKDNSLSYIEYINSENKYIQSNKFQKDKEYWNNLFATIPEVATIPSLKDSTKDDDINANRILLDIGAELFSKLKSYCSENKVSLYNFFMSVFALYLGRVSNLDEFVIGTPILNRTNYKEKETTGMFINTLPLKITLSHEKTFLDNLKNIAVNSMSLLRHQKYSFQYLIEDLRKKDSNLPKLYNVLYSYQITKMNDNMDSLNHVTSWTFNKTIADDLEIHMFEWNDNDSIQIAYDYKTSKYDEQDISDLHARILHVINQILENNNILLKDIEIVTPEEKHQILYEFNNTKTDYPKDKTIVDLFEEQVEKTPDNIAVVFEDQKLTYRELNEKANQLARYLIEKGVKKGDVVALFMNKSVEVIVSILSILKVGATYLPLDTSYPQERINYILSDAKAKIILTTSIQNINISFKDIYSINVSFSSQIYISNKTNVNNITHSINDLAYITYTSGSTGKPKGVMIPHLGVIRLVKNTNYIQFNTDDRILQTGSIVFDASTFEIFGALLNGISIYLLSKENLLNPKLFKYFIKLNHITIIFLTTALFNKYCDEDPTMFSEVRTLLTGGEAVSNKHMKLAKQSNPNLNLIHVYGPTENTTFSTYYIVNNDLSHFPIGKPISNSTTYVISKDGNLCPLGVPGELAVGGDGLAIGYLNNESLTHMVFIKSSFNNSKIYKTGDLVRLLPDGNIDFIGRIDNQVKIRGFRIELSGIDSVILTFPNIKQSFSTVSTINNQKYICSYIVTDQTIDITELKRYLSNRLANYMIPTCILNIDKMPLTINGKIDKKALPLPYFEDLSVIEKPRNNIDNIIIDSVNSILGISINNIATNFFDIGIDSLSAISLSSKISNIVSRTITVHEIFKFPVIKDLSDYISSIAESKNAIIIKKSENKAYYPISSAQKRVYYAWLRDKNSLLYNIAGGIIVEGDIDKSKIENCFKTLIKRHSSLRTCFEQKDEDIVQIIKETVDFKLDYEVSNTNDVDFIYRNFVKPFDLSTAPLFRTKLVKLNNKNSILLLDMHHIISDGTSLNILLQELCNLYNGETLSHKELEYKDFTVWEQSQINTDNFKKQKEYWVNQFKDEIPLLNMPTSYPRPSVQSFEGSNYHAKLSKEQFSKINLLAQKLGITPYMLMLSVYYILLSKYTSQDDIVIGTPIVGRDMPELTNMLGMFVNTLALRNNIEHKLTFKEFSNQIKENCLNSFKNQTYPFDMLVNDLNIKRDTSRNPLFDVMFVFQNNGYPNIHLNGVKSEYYIPDNNISKFDLTLEVVPINNEYALRFEYCTKLFEEDFIKRLSSHYINILNAILDNEEIKIADIDMLSKEERNQILYEFNNIKAPINSDTFVSLFEKQVKLNPNNIAIICDGKSLTYSELNKKANSLAHFLLTNDVNPNDIVAIVTNRSFETIVSMIGILKAGAAFVNMDPTYPVERTTYYLEDSKAKCVLKQSDISLPIDFQTVYNIDLNNNEIYGKNETNPNINIELNTLSYIIYTSGSTGTPKGVVLNHLGLANMCKAMTLVLDYLKDAINHTLLSVTSTPFDIFVYEIVVPLSHGMRIVLANNSEHRNPKLIDKLIRDYNVDVMTVTPSLMKINYDNREPNSALANVKNMVFGGEPLPEKFIKDLKSLSNDITIYNIYGPSEITVLSNVQNLNGEKCINIGPPILNTYIYVLDNDMNPLPTGIPGEIYIGGVQVGCGYLGKEDLTNEKFIKNPFDEGRMFKSGDIGKWTADGKLQCLGRLDHQVKLRGLRVELGEIENKLESIPEIDSAVVNKVIVDNVEALCAYYVLNKDINEDDIRSTLKSDLPYYMVPKYFVKLDKMPYTINRKIDRKSLPLPNAKHESINNIDINKLSDTSQKLLQIWKDILKVTNVSIYDNFFDIGGDSISAIKLQIECVKYGINIEYSDIFKYPTIKLLLDNINVDNKFDISNYQSKEINNLIAKNNISCLKSIKRYKISNMLLIGTTGYLGIHLIHEFLKQQHGIAYCLVREKNNIDPYSRFKENFIFYFGNKEFVKYQSRIKIIKGDITQENLGLCHDDLDLIKNNVSMIINSGALVKHFGNSELFENINVIGTQNIVDFCVANHMRLLHISTISVSGNGDKFSDSTSSDVNKIFDETTFNINQDLYGIYSYTKFKAEYIVLNAIVNSDLDATIYRVGNITNRYSDGFFQRNINDNAFVKRLKSFINIGFFPEYLLNHEIEWSPVDLCAKAIIKSANYISDCTILHIYNNNLISIKSFVNLLNNLGYKLIGINNKTMSNIITGMLEDDSQKNILDGIIYDLHINKNLIYTSNIKLISDFSIKYLRKIGFSWNKKYIKYLKKSMHYFAKINYINQKE